MKHNPKVRLSRVNLGVQSIMCASELSALRYSEASLFPIQNLLKLSLMTQSGRGETCQMRHAGHRSRQLETSNVEANSGLSQFLFVISETCFSPPRRIRKGCTLRSSETGGVNFEALKRGRSVTSRDVFIQEQMCNNCAERRPALSRHKQSASRTTRRKGWR